MRYYANASSRRVREVMAAGSVGMIATPDEGRLPWRLHVAEGCDYARRRRSCPHDDHHAAAVDWCADNSCFGVGYPGDARWLAWLERLSRAADRCAFATAPDVVGDAVATLERSAPFLPAIRALGYPAALVAQDGLEDLEVPWDTFDVLFLGGSTAWKLSGHAARLVHAARDRGKRVHMGRVNSGTRWRIAETFGCDSCDGTFLAYGPDTNLPRMAGWSDGSLFAA